MAVLQLYTPNTHYGLRARCGSCGRVTRLVVQAATTHGSKARHTYERVLRYPSGETRYIRYPVEATLDEEDDVDSFAAWDVSGLSSLSMITARGSQSRQQVRRL